MRARGFTLLELLVVIAIMALATAGVGLALRDNAHELLDREGLRLAALLDAARAQSRASGAALRWRATETGFRFEGQDTDAMPRDWIDPRTQASSEQPLILGPEPILPPQAVWITHADRPGQRLRIASDGLRPFSIQSLP